MSYLTKLWDEYQQMLREGRVFDALIAAARLKGATEAIAIIKHEDPSLVNDPLRDTYAHWAQDDIDKMRPEDVFRSK